MSYSADERRFETVVESKLSPADERKLRGRDVSSFDRYQTGTVVSYTLSSKSSRSSLVEKDGNFGSALKESTLSGVNHDDSSSNSRTKEDVLAEDSKEDEASLKNRKRKIKRIVAKPITVKLAFTQLSFFVHFHSLSFFTRLEFKVFVKGRCRIGQLSAVFTVATSCYLQKM